MKLLYLVANQEMTESRASFVAEVAHRLEADLQILVTAEDPAVLEKTKASYDQAQHVFDRTVHQVRFVKGDPAKEMHSELDKDGYDMVLFAVGRRKRLIPSQYRLLSQQIIKKARVPVLLVRESSNLLNRMLVCTGGMDISEPVVTLSASLAGKVGMQATLLTVASPVPSMYTGMAEMEETMEELLETDTPLAQHLRRCAKILTDSGISAEIKVIHGDVVEGILEETEIGNYDLVVLGSTEGLTLRGILLGNVTQQIINRAVCAVLVVK